MEETMIQISPVKLLLPSDRDAVKTVLSYIDKSVGYQIRKVKENIRWRKGDPESWKVRLEELKVQQNKTMLFYDEQGRPWTYSGLRKMLQKMFGWKWTTEVVYPESELIPWNKKPFTMRPYQAASFEGLVEAGHGAIELPTGSGKSLVAFYLLKYHGLKSVLVAPRSRIADQLYNELIEVFGKKYVGKFDGKKKEYKKLFTVATAQSMSRVELNSPAGEVLSQSQVFIFDESHMVPAATFEKLCLGLMENVPYRYFISATQVRGDGSEHVLEGITSSVVYRETYRSLVDQKYLKPVKVKIFSTGFMGIAKRDPMEQTREHLYMNPKVNKLAGQMISYLYNNTERSVLVLVEEIDQLNQLINFINVPFEVIHGQSGGKEIKERLPSRFWKPDSERILSLFNDRTCRVLVGTSCISMGVDTRPTGALLYMQGKSSQSKVLQAVGRGSRPYGSDDLLLVDFRVLDQSVCERHLNARVDLYRELTDDIEYIGGK